MKTLSRAEKHAQCVKEAKATLAVVAVCAAWHIGTAFALNGNGAYLLGMPAWFTVSVLGTSIIGIIGVVLLAKFVFVDFEYDEEVDDGPGLVVDAALGSGSGFDEPASGSNVAESASSPTLAESAASTTPADKAGE